MNNPPRSRSAQVEDILKRLFPCTFVILLSVVGVIQYHRRRRRRRGILLRHRQVTAVPEMIVRRGRRRGSSRRQRWTRDDPPRRHRRIRGAGIVLLVRVVAYDEPAVAVAQLHYVLKHRRCEESGLTLRSVLCNEKILTFCKDRINDSNYVPLNFERNDLNSRSIKIIMRIAIMYICTIILQIFFFF